jgi:hypothetical protein
MAGLIPRLLNEHFRKFESIIIIALDQVIDHKTAYCKQDNSIETPRNVIGKGMNNSNITENI